MPASDHLKPLLAAVLVLVRRGEDEARQSKDDFLQALAMAAWAGMAQTGGQDVVNNQLCEQQLSRR